MTVHIGYIYVEIEKYFISKFRNIQLRGAGVGGVVIENVNIMKYFNLSHLFVVAGAGTLGLGTSRVGRASHSPGSGSER